MSDITDYRPVAEVAEQELGKRPAPPTVHRWLHKGNFGNVKLRAVFVHGRWMTTRELFLQFLEERTAARLAGSKYAAPEQSAERPPETSRRLQAAGLL